MEVRWRGGWEFLGGGQWWQAAFGHAHTLLYCYCCWRFGDSRTKARTRWDIRHTKLNKQWQDKNSAGKLRAKTGEELTPKG